MFCPQCGKDSPETQKFCKSCGTNLQVVSDALDNGADTLGKLRVDMDAVKRNIGNIANEFKAGIHGVSINHDARSTQRAIRQKIRADLKRDIQPKRKDWLALSWQHNLRNGLISLFAGGGLGLAWYYFGRIAIEAGVISSIEEAANGHVHGLEELAKYLWLFAAIPVFKGVAQILFACFAESVATLSARFAPPAQNVELPPRSYEPTEPRDYSTGNVGERPAETPGSVTEHTTKIFVDGQAQVSREAQ